MMQEDHKKSHSPAHPGTSRIETKNSSSLTAGSITGVPELEKTSSPTQVASYEYMGTTYYRHEGIDVPTTSRHEGIDIPTTSRHKPPPGTNDGIKLLPEEAVAYRSHRTPANVRGQGDSWPGGGGSWSCGGGSWPGGGGSWPRKSLLSSFGEDDLTHNFKIQESLAMRRDSKFASSWKGSKSDYYNAPLYTKSGQPYVPISIANTKWYRTRLASGENDETHSEPICHREKGVLSQGSHQDSFVEELANEESNEFLKVEAIEDLSVKDLKCLKLTATPAKALVRIFEPMLENWKEVISAVSVTSDKKNVNKNIKENNGTSETTFVVEPECKENGMSVPILPRNENESIILEEMSQKLLGNSTPVSPRILLPQKHQDKSNAKNPEIKEELQCKETSFREDVTYANSYSPATGLLEDVAYANSYTPATGLREDVAYANSYSPATGLREDDAYANSYSPATGLRMIEASSCVRNYPPYVFTIGDRGEISRVLTPLVKELVIINKLGGKGKKCTLEIGVIVESQQQFFCVIKAANTSFKARGFQFKPLANIGNGRDVLNCLNSAEVIPKVDCNGMYQITVKFNLPKGNEKKAEESLGRELEKEVQGCRVEKISFGPGERILQIGHVEDMFKVAKKVTKVFDIIPSKHIWTNELCMVRKKEKKRRDSLKKKESKAKKKESKKGELKISDSPNLKPIAVQKTNTLDLNLPMIQQEKEESAPLLSNHSVTLTLFDSDSACDPSEMQLESSLDTTVIISHDPNTSATRSPPPGDRDDNRSEVKTSPLTSFIRSMEGGDRNSDLKLLQDSFVKCPNDNEENEGQAFEMLEKAMAAGDDADGEMLKKTIAAGNDNGKKLENGMAAGDDDNDKMLEKAMDTGDDNQNIKSKVYFLSQDGEDLRKENFQSQNEVCQLGEENKLIFEGIDESKIDIVKEDTNWYGNVSDFMTIKNNCSSWNVHVIFEAKEATEIAYFGLREKYNGVCGGCKIDI